MARARTTTTAPTTIDAIRHGDKRANIPTEELRDFVADDERAPKTLRYPRDPSLDPQLVWKGKDEQDSEDLAVPAVPIYIQEKIDPHAIIEDIRRSSSLVPRPSSPAPQLSLFGDFDGEIAFDEMVEFYRHEQNWSNRMILGDSSLVMTSLAEKEGLRGKVQTIYIDPPYGIRFGSNWQVSTRKRDVKDGRAEDLTRQPEQIKAFRDTWQLGIHSYLTYLRDRLTVARELLTESGSIFVQIGDENVHLVRCLMDEVFGSENFVAQITFVKTTGQRTEGLHAVTDYLLWYAKNAHNVKVRSLFVPRTESSDDEESFASTDLTSINPGYWYEYEFQGRSFDPGRRFWTLDRHKIDRLAAQDRLYASTASLRYKRLAPDFPVQPSRNVWTDTATGSFTDAKIYVVQTGTKAIQRCLLMTTDPGDLVLDPTCGSGTTAYVAEQWGRRWITIDTSRVALALARTRLMGAKFPYYLLADSEEGRAKERDEGRGTGDGENRVAPGNDIRKGFVYRRVPHVTLKAIANNEEIDAIYARYQERLEPLRARLNELTKQAWEEWEIPREADPAWPHPAENVHADWWRLRRERQAEIDASIARRADSETLYDQPFEDRKRVRVTGPFTVESLSPHRVLTTDEERPASERIGQRDGEAQGGGFVPMILDNLLRAGVQNTVRQERLKLERLEPFAGEWLQAAGEYAGTDGVARRVAVAIGPEHGTVGPELVKEAAKEALRGAGFDLLIVCGFAFDAHASETSREFAPSTNGRGADGFVAEESRQYGRLPVLLARMNPDLAMGQELLKSTGAGNLFMVFGEPDVDIRRQPDGRIVVEVRGVDVYDPTTGNLRSNSTDDIACWFIDSDYNDESFFVRQAYFTGADEPYDKLKRALRAEIDEDAWSQLYSTTSRPFDAPTTGKIAVKVINHYGDEVLKVYTV
jgi:adenine-specific DNA-methyltransferase